jgi:hypothetical protein
MSGKELNIKMKKISYIVPTILKFDNLINQLVNIGNIDCVGEIIIINNSNGIKLPSFNCNANIIEIIPESPSFCNGGWNLGAEKSSFDYIILSTDDLEFDANILNIITSKINTIEPFGIIGMDYKSITDNYSSVEDDIIFEEAIGEREYGFGMMMFMDRNNFIKIPDCLRHWYGDDFLYYSMMEKNLNNYILKSNSFKLKTRVGSMSESSETKDRIDEDTTNWERYYKGPFKQIFVQ